MGVGVASGYEGVGLGAWSEFMGGVVSGCVAFRVGVACDHVGVAFDVWPSGIGCG